MEKEVLHWQNLSDNNQQLPVSCEAANNLCQNLFENWNIAIVYGASMGDEWKGKVATAVAHLKDLAWVAAPTWGWNAWHTVYANGKKISLHELPGGATIQHSNVYLGQWRVIHIQWLIKEIEELHQADVSTQWRIYIAGWAHIIFQTLQKHLDGYIESLKWSNSVGTTKAGIWPAYALKAFRTSVTINDILHNSGSIKEKFKTNIALFTAFDHLDNHDREACDREYNAVRDQLLELIKNKDVIIDKYNIILKDEAIKGKKILVECSQSALLAIDWWFYPNVTSSDTTPNGVWSWLALPPLSHTNIAVLKSIKSKVGKWPFPTKLPEWDMVEKYREATGEFGATTGRKRDIGWFDTIETRKVLTSHPTNIIVLTRLDDLHHMWTVKFAQQYTNKQGEIFTHHTPLEYEYDHLQVQYSRDYNVKEDITGINSFNKLPWEYKSYVNDLVDALQFNGRVYLGTGPASADMIEYTR